MLFHNLPTLVKRISESVPSARLCCLQVSQSGQFTDKFLVCPADAHIVQHDRQMFEALSLAMCAASAGDSSTLNALSGRPGPQALLQLCCQKKCTVASCPCSYPTNTDKWQVCDFPVFCASLV